METPKGPYPVTNSPPDVREDRDVVIRVPGSYLGMPKENFSELMRFLKLFLIVAVILGVGYAGLSIFGKLPPSAPASQTPAQSR